MKKYTLTFFLILSIAFTVTAQTGVYRTYENFKNGILLKADDNSLAVKTMKHKVTLKSNGEVNEFNTPEIFGVMMDGSLYRFYPVNGVEIACKLVGATDQYAIWDYQHTYFNGPGSSPAKGATSTSTLYYLSKGLDGKIVYLDNFKTTSLAENKEFKSIYDCVKSGKKIGLMNPVSRAVWECMANDPTYKKRPEDAIPALK